MSLRIGMLNTSTGTGNFQIALKYIRSYLCLGEQMIINPLERVVDGSSDERKMEFLNNLAYRLIGKYGGQVPDQLYAGNQYVKGAYRNYLFRTVGKWNTGHFTREHMAQLEQFLSSLYFSNTVQGEKTPFGKRAKVARYVDFNGRRSSIKKGFLVCDYPPDYSQIGLGIWATRNFATKADAKEQPHRIPVKWFYEESPHTVELRAGEPRERTYVEFPVQISHILKYGEMVPRDRLLYDICRNIVLYDIAPHKREDAGGLDKTIDEILWRVFSPFKNRAAAKRYGFTPESVIMTGVPGVGKTLIASVLANMEYDALFVPVDAWSLVMAQVRESGSKNDTSCPIFDTLATLKKSAGVNSVLHVDDVESVLLDPEHGGKGKESLAASSELLNRMKGLREEHNVPIIGSTNKPWEIDDRFIQFGRFTRVLYIERPDKRGREAIMRIHMGGRPLDGELDPERVYDYVASRTNGWTGEHLKQFSNEAGRQAAIRATGGDFERFSKLTDDGINRFPIGAQDIVRGFEKTLFGIDLEAMDLQDKKIREFCARFEQKKEEIGFATPSRNGHEKGLITASDAANFLKVS